ncbi:Glu/Leu/Phe/Val dehydrogenase dimerization domain-containing protein [Fodinicola acaciae]|uniref:Glu/Leu/Phe/Val dehydrogenase dimerization domain-containing protein n=1 Tax=Fodinicola acaciae TaxID=2681555 RepID=UPI001FE4E370|nr:Glu/Leu/Phe/Val dehydrogenase dimerization domain-containing protein [Fodinicola acaciae]
MAWEHQQLVVRRGERTGLPVAVAIHSTVLGPAAGGCRLWQYPDWRAGVEDVLRLSKAMTYKCAVAGLSYGGGKTVIPLPAGRVLTTAEREAVLEDAADIVDSFGGAYLTGPDVGTSSADMVVMRRRTPYAYCLPESEGGTGSSSGPTAVGVLAALRAAARTVLGTDDLAGRRVVISGLGSVGAIVARSLAGGAEVVVSDVDDAKRRTAEELDLSWVEPEKALATPADIIVPAAVGGVLSPETVARLDCALVVGPANNQLTDDSVAGALAGRGIVWVPDFVASAGGVIYTLSRESDRLDHDGAMARVERIGDTVGTLLAQAHANRSTPLAEAIALADRRLSGS